MKKMLFFAGALAVAAAGGYITNKAMQSDMHQMSVQATAGDLSISNSSARFLLDNRPGAVFLTIHNKGAADKLVSATSSLSPRVELHTTAMDNGVMKMRKVEAIEVPANGKAELKSGGYHIMLFDVAKKPEKGSKVPLSLMFKKAGKVDIDVTVGDAAQMAH